MKYSLTEVKPNIFLLNFKNYYDLSMLFLRYQEFYESPSPRFRGKQFEIIDFMEWYSHKYGKGVFTYPADWGGFNIPSKILEEVESIGITDQNKYDIEMWNIYEKCSKKSDNFYLIGAVGKKGALKHEIAHGFFYTIPEYKKEMVKLVKALNPSFRQEIYKTLKKLGYTPKVYVDECQAYMSTGLTDAFTMKLKDEQKPFINLYNKYYRK